MTATPSSTADWTDAFLEMMAVERAAANNTLTAYGKDLADAGGFLAKHGVSLADASADEVEAYFADLGARGMAAATAAAAAGGGTAVLSLRPGRGLADG